MRAADRLLLIAVLAALAASCAGNPATRPPSPTETAPRVDRAGPSADPEPAELPSGEPATPDEGDGEEEELAASWYAGLISVEATVNGRGPLLLWLDSGTSFLTLTPRAVDELGLERVALTDDGSGVVLGAVSGEVTVREGAPVDELHIGSVVLRDTGALIVDLSAFERATGSQIDGIVPFAAFEGRLLTIDPASRTVTLTGGELPAADGRDVLRLLDVDSRPFIELDLGDGPCPTMIDTGFVGYLKVPMEREDSLVFTSDLAVVGRQMTAGGVFDRAEGRLDATLALGRHRIEHPIVTVSPAPFAVAGAGLLNEFRTTYDMRNGRVRFTRAGDEPLTCPPVRSAGFGYMPRDGRWVVAYVLPASSAEHAGLEVGDRIARVDGRVVATVSRDEFNEWIATRDALTLRVTTVDGMREMRVDVEVLIE